MNKKTTITEKIKKASGNVNRENVKKALLTDKVARREKYILLTLTALLIGFGMYVGISFVIKYTSLSEPMMREIDLTTYLSYKESKGIKIVFATTNSSKVAASYEKIVSDVLTERNIQVSHLDLGIIASRNQTATFMKANDITRNTYTEPMLLIFDGGEIVDSLMGVHSKNKIEEFLALNRAY